MLEDQSRAEPELQQRTRLGLEQVETHQENHIGVGLLNKVRFVISIRDSFLWLI
jgi:hypothetical protein